MDELIRRSDAIKAIEALAIHTDERYLNDLEYGHNEGLAHAIDRIEDIPSADRPNSVDLTNVYTVAYENGYKQGKADRPKGEWIDCKEPPSTDRNVFIAYGTDDMKSVCIGHYRHDMKLWYEDKNFFAKPIYDAMYWCEIPQFPTRLKGANDE